jgi:hypothetical protein
MNGLRIIEIDRIARPFCVWRVRRLQARGTLIKSGYVGNPGTQGWRLHAGSMQMHDGGQMRDGRPERDGGWFWQPGITYTRSAAPRGF